MFEVYKKCQSQRWGAKILVSSVVGVLLSLGLCGLGAVTGDTKVSPFFFGTGIIVLGLSVLGIIVGVVWAVVDGIRSGDK